MTEGNTHDEEQDMRKNRKRKTKGKRATKPEFTEDVKSEEMQMEGKKGKKRKIVENTSEGKKASETLGDDSRNENTSVSEKKKKKKETKKSRGDGNAGDVSKMEDTSENRDVMMAPEEDQQTGKEKPLPKRKGKNKQKKKKKKNQAPASNQSHVEAQRACVRYLQLWDTDRAKWHFQKVRQVWLLQNMYDKEKVPKSEFHILLRYLENMRGKSREMTIKHAEDLIKQLEDKMQNLKDQETSSDGGGKKEETDAEDTKKMKVQWRRATDILQTLT